MFWSSSAADATAWSTVHLCSVNSLNDCWLCGMQSTGAVHAAAGTYVQLNYCELEANKATGGSGVRVLDLS